MLPPALEAVPALLPLLSGPAEPFAGLAPAAQDALLTQAHGHGLLAALAGTIPAGDARLLSRFERMSAGVRLGDGRNRAVLAEVAGLLSAAGITPVALKGPVLADRLYPDPGLRPCTDLDLLVSPEELPRAVDALVAAGFQRADPLQDAYQLEHHHHLHLLRTPGPHVEVHFRAVSGCGAAIPTRELLARARLHRTLQGVPIRVLAPEDELLTLAVHAAGHAFMRLGWVLDLVYFLQRHPALDWEAVLRRAAEGRCRRALAYTCGVLRALRAPLPDDPALELPPARGRVADRLAAEVLQRDGKVRMAFFVAYQHALRDRGGEIPGAILAELGWVIRRRAVRLRRRLRGPEPAAPLDRPIDPPLRSVPAPFWQPVRGRSMLPTLQEGDEVLLDAPAALAPGDVIVLRHPTRSGTLLHRIVELGDAHVLTQGDGCRAADPPARPAHVLFRAVALRRRGQILPIPPRPPVRARGWRRLGSRRR